MPDQEKTITRSIEFEPKAFKTVSDFAKINNRAFKAEAKTLIEEALVSREENGA